MTPFKVMKSSILILSLITLSACSGIRVSGVKPVFIDKGIWNQEADIDEYDDVKLAKLIVENTPGQKSPEDSNKYNTIEKAVAFFNTKHKPIYANFNGLNTTEAATARSENAITEAKTVILGRNTIQDAILRASETKCNEYKRTLRQDSADGDFLGSAVSTTLGAVGAIVTGREASRVFAGLAGGASGVGAAWSQSYFSNLATSVIVPGIERRRATLLADIASKRCYSLETYTVMYALRDAVAYHGACMIDVGIAEAGKIISQTDDPGIKNLTASLRHYAQMQSMMNIAANGGKKEFTGTDTPVFSVTSGVSPYSTIDGVTLPFSCDPRITPIVAAAPVSKDDSLRVYFDPTVTTLAASSDYARDIRALAAQYAAGDYAMDVKIEGKADGEDTPANRSFAQRRAETVANIFKDEINSRGKKAEVKISTTIVPTKTPPSEFDRMATITLTPKPKSS